ncbi:MAG: hypothetical protein U0836_18205 [Pirellulales bacterium]
MPTVRQFTVADSIDHLVAFAVQNAKPSTVQKCREAVRAAVAVLALEHPWTYLLRHDRLAVSAPFSTGTISYTHSTLTVTLSAGSFPSWAARATIYFGSAAYEVESMPTSGTLKLTATSNPGADVTAGTAFALYRDLYLLPADFMQGDRFFEHSTRKPLEYTGPADFFQQRRDQQLTGLPRYYSFLGDRDDPSRMMVRLTPFPSAATNLDYTYLRTPREPIFDRYEAGLVTTAGTTAVSSTGATFTDAMAGSVLRVAFSGAPPAEESAAVQPQWFERMALPYPYVYERMIVGQTGGNALTVDAAIPALSGVKYLISDPIDIEPTVMRRAFLRCAEWQLGLLLKSEDVDRLEQAYQGELQRAIQADVGRDLTLVRQDETKTASVRERKLPTNTGR